MVLKENLTTAYIALGSNLQNPVLQLTTALDTLKNLPEITLDKTSSFYQTAPIGFLQQPDFINAVCAIKTKLSAEALLLLLQHIEINQGRIRNGLKNGPRTLDLDILLYGNYTIKLCNLEIPHPHMYHRSFVLVPLAEIAPDLVLPNHFKASEWVIKNKYTAQKLALMEKCV